VVLAVFLAPAAVFLWAYRAELRRAPTEALLLAGAVALFGLAIVGDLLGAPVEEPSEVASALLATAAFVRICAGELRLTTSLTPGAARR
ncbi:MAG: hypothetical protein ACRDLY_13955, partial [Thermoleophilaceae bacterium]